MRFAALALLTLSLTACGKSQGGGDVGEKDSIDAYNQASCQFSFDSGEPVDTAVAEKADPREMLFGKPLPYHLFRAVSRASGRATAEFMVKHGARPYGISGTEEGCAFARDLDPAPADIAADWKEAVAELPSTSMLLGQYLAKDTPLLPSTRKNAVIALRRDANREIFIHEFTHHLFELGRLERGEVPRQELRVKLLRLDKQADELQDDYDSAPSAESARKLISRFLELSALARKALVISKLEEVAIETLILWEAKEDRLHFAPLVPRSNQRYIVSSARKAQEGLKEISLARSKVETYASKFALAEEQHRLQKEAAAIADLHQQIELAARPAEQSLAADQRMDAPALALIAPGNSARDLEEEPATLHRCAHSAQDTGVPSAIRRLAL